MKKIGTMGAIDGLSQRIDSGRSMHVLRWVTMVTLQAPGAIYHWIRLHEAKRFSRIALSELTDDQLRDIGVTPQEARREVERPYWR